MRHAGNLGNRAVRDGRHTLVRDRDGAGLGRGMAPAGERVDAMADDQRILRIVELVKQPAEHGHVRIVGHRQPIADKQPAKTQPAQQSVGRQLAQRQAVGQFVQKIAGHDAGVEHRFGYLGAPRQPVPEIRTCRQPGAERGTHFLVPGAGLHHLDKQLAAPALLHALQLQHLVRQVGRQRRVELRQRLDAAQPGCQIALVGFQRSLGYCGHHLGPCTIACAQHLHRHIEPLRQRPQREPGQPFGLHQGTGGSQQFALGQQAPRTTPGGRLTQIRFGVGGVAFVKHGGVL